MASCEGDENISGSQSRDRRAAARHLSRQRVGRLRRRVDCGGGRCERAAPPAARCDRPVSDAICRAASKQARRRSSSRRTSKPRCRSSPRLADVELPRTTGQLRQAADAALEGSWALPTIDTKNQIRSCFEPIGPVVVFGPNNFPFAFSGVAGGDFAAAIAAGNPVIGKGASAASGNGTVARRGRGRRAPRNRIAAGNGADDLQD